MRWLSQLCARRQRALAAERWIVGAIRAVKASTDQRSAIERRLASRASLEASRILDLDVPSSDWVVVWATQRSTIDVGEVTAFITETDAARLRAVGFAAPLGWKAQLEFSRGLDDEGVVRDSIAVSLQTTRSAA